MIRALKQSLLNWTKLRVPIYMHPGYPLPKVQQPYHGGFDKEVTARLSLFGLGWHNEAGIDLLRVLLSKKFDQFPNLQVISCHWGEMVPFHLQRLDDTMPEEVTGLSRSITETFKQHVYVTPSGMLNLPHFQFIHTVLGVDRILYSVDYPYLMVAGARSSWGRFQPARKTRRRLHMEMLRTCLRFNKDFRSGMHITLALILAGGIFMEVAAPAQTLPNPSELILTNVTIVDTHTGKLTPHATLVIENGKITKIVRFAKVDASSTAQRVDGHGNFVVPGFWDMHAHPFNNPNLADNLSLMLTYGITGVRQMAGSPQLLEARKEGKLIPSTNSPELLALPGDLLLPTNAGTPQAAVAEVRKQKSEGADFIKTIQVSPDAFFASLAEATRQGLPYEGHLSPGVSASKASEAGMRAIEHLGAGQGMLVDCSSDEAAVRQAIARQLPRPSTAQAASEAAAILNQKIGLASPVLASSLSDPNYIKQTQHLIDTYSESKCRALAQTFTAHQTWQTPTLIRLRTAAFANDAFYSNNPDLQYASPSSLELWHSVAERYSSLSPKVQETLHRAFTLQMKIAKLFDETGVQMLAGSDCGGSVWEVFGASLHQEFDLLSQAGLSPLKILQMTTLNGAEFYNRQATAGSVEEGKEANLVLLEGNPVASVQNLHKINAVVRAGVYYSSTTLHAVKHNVAEHLASASASDGSPNGTS